MSSMPHSVWLRSKSSPEKRCLATTSALTPITAAAVTKAVVSTCGTVTWLVELSKTSDGLVSTPRPRQIDLEADRVRHPWVGGKDEPRRQRGADRHRAGATQVHPFRQAVRVVGRSRREVRGRDRPGLQPPPRSTVAFRGQVEPRDHVQQHEGQRDDAEAKTCAVLDVEMSALAATDRLAGGIAVLTGVRTSANTGCESY
jgi:hypothetical protein